MKAVVRIVKEGKWFVATDLLTQVADQGRTRDEARANLRKGLRERYETLLKLAPRKRGRYPPPAMAFPVVTRTLPGYGIDSPGYPPRAAGEEVATRG